MKKTLKRSLIMTLVAVLLIGTFAVTAEAAMKRTVKKQDETTKISIVFIVLLDISLVFLS